MTYEELKQLFPNASEFVLRASCDPTPVATPIMERHHAPGLAGPIRDTEAHPTKYIVRLKAFRINLLDEDNICEKLHVDSLRYAGLIHGDGPGQCKIETSQEQVFRESEECTEIEIIPPQNMNPQIVAVTTDYAQRLRRWLELKKANPNLLEAEPSNSHIENRWLAEMTRKQLLKEFEPEKEKKKK